jgi:hypothetical protein
MSFRTIPAFLFSTSLFVLHSTAVAQNTFEITIPLTGLTDVAGGHADPEGGFVFGGELGESLVVFRCDSTGAVQWTRQLDESANEEGIYNRSLAVSGNRILMGGYAMGPSTASRDGILHVLDLDGTLIAQRIIDVGQNSNAIHSITATDDGALIAGRASGAGSYDMLLQQVDQNGEVQGSWSYGSNGWDWGYEAIGLNDGGMALVGYGDEVGGPAPSAYLVRTDAQGQELWARGIDGASADEGYCVMEDPANGDLYLGGTSLGMGASGIQGFISRFSADGDHIWTRVITNAFDVIGLVPNTAGRFTALARAQNIAGGHGNYDALLLTFNAQGDLLSNRLFGTPASEYPVSLSRTASGGLLTTCLLSGNATNAVHAVLTDVNGGGSCTGISVQVGWNSYTPTIVDHSSILQNGHNTTDYTTTTAQPEVEREFVCCTYPVLAGYTGIPGAGTDWTFANSSQGVGTITWNIAGTSLSGDTVSYTFPSAGTFQVCMTIEGVCATDQVCDAVQVIGTGVEAIDAPHLTLTPNPATDHLRFTAPSGLRAVEVLDVHGRVLRSWPVNNAKTLDLDLTGLPGGVLLLRSTSSVGIQVQRFVKL